MIQIDQVGAVTATLESVTPYMISSTTKVTSLG